MHTLPVWQRQMDSSCAAQVEVSEEVRKGAVTLVAEGGVRG
jgi:hypothetical protein